MRPNFKIPNVKKQVYAMIIPLRVSYNSIWIMHDFVEGIYYLQKKLSPCVFESSSETNWRFSSFHKVFKI